MRLLLCYNTFAANQVTVAFLAGYAFELLYSSVKKEKHRIEQFFKELIDVHRTRTDDEGEAREGLSTRPNRRIIYLKDMGSIARSAKLLVACILRAIHDIRQGTDEYPVFILVLGVSALTRAQKLFDRGGSTIFSFPCYDSFDAIASTIYLTSLIPPLESRVGGLDPVTPGDFSSLFFAAGTPSRGSSSDSSFGYHEPGSKWEQRVRAAADRSDVLSIQPKDMDASAIRHLHQYATTERVKCINRTLMRISIGSRGGHLQSDAEDSWATLVSSEDRLLVPLSFQFQLESPDVQLPVQEIIFNWRSCHHRLLTLSR